MGSSIGGNLLAAHYDSLSSSYDSLSSIKDAELPSSVSDTKKSPDLKPNKPLLRRISFRNIGGRNVIVKGVPISDLPPEGYEVSFETSDRADNNPDIEVINDTLRVRGPSAQNQLSFSSFTRHGGRSVVAMHGRGSVFTMGNSTFINTGGDATYVDGFPLHQLEQISQNQPAPERLSDIVVRVPESVSVRSTDCEKSTLNDIGGKVEIKGSSDSKLYGNNLGETYIKSSGSIYASLNNIKGLSVESSGSSTIYASKVSSFAKFYISGISTVNISDANGDFSANLSGSGHVNAQGGFSKIDVDLSGSSRVDIRGGCDTTPKASVSGSGSVCFNGRNIAPARSSRNMGYSNIIFQGNGGGHNPSFFSY